MPKPQPATIAKKAAAPAKGAAPATPAPPQTQKKTPRAPRGGPPPPPPRRARHSRQGRTRRPESSDHVADAAVALPAPAAARDHLRRRADARRAGRRYLAGA